MPGKKPDFGAALTNDNNRPPAPKFETVYGGIKLPSDLQSSLSIVVAPDKSILVGENFIIHENRLEIVGQVDRDAWLEFARWMRSLDDTLQWALGDLVVYADEQRAAWIEETGLTETELESKYKDLIETTGYAYSTLRKFASFARRFPPFRRRNTLSHSHHVEVAALTDEQQEYLLDQATAEKWSRNQLRLAAQGIDLSGNGNGTVAENAQVATEATPLPDEIRLPEAVSLPPRVTIQQRKEQVDKLFHHWRRDTLKAMPRDDLYMLKQWVDELWETRKKLGD